MRSNGPTKTSITPELLEQYLGGEIHGNDVRRVEQWLAERPEWAKQMRGLKTMAEDGVSPVPRARVDALWNTIDPQPQPVQHRQVPLKSQPRQRPWARRILIPLAPVAAALAVGVVFLRPVDPAASGRQDAPSEFYTAPGQRATVTLKNGSLVTLAPGTRLNVMYETDGVRVILSGEAMFSVPHASVRPFVISSHDVVTRVLGTDFAVRAYDALAVRVAVLDGRVSVQAPTVTENNAVVVSQGQSAIVAHHGVPLVTSVNSNDPAFAWATGTLVLRDTPLSEALVELSRWYGREFRVVDQQLLGTRVDAQFPEHFDSALIQDFADILGARAQITAQNVMLFIHNNGGKR